MDSGFRVVVADDDRDARLLLTTALRRDGRFDVVGEATDGAEAVELARETAPDLVLLDLAMPGLGGLDALPLLRTASPATRVVVVSGFPGDRLESVMRARGAVGYVEKGLSPKQTVREVVAVAGVLDAIDGVLSARETFERELSSSRAARRFLEATLSMWSCDELLDNVSLLVSELVTNAVVHGGSEAEVAVVLLSDRLRVEVADGGEGMPTAKQVSLSATSGRGIALVDTLSTDWGVEPIRTGGKVVWFELARPDVG